MMVCDRCERRPGTPTHLLMVPLPELREERGRVDGAEAYAVELCAECREALWHSVQRFINEPPPGRT